MEMVKSKWDKKNDIRKFVEITTLNTNMSNVVDNKMILIKGDLLEHHFRDLTLQNTIEVEGYIKESEPRNTKNSAICISERQYR